MNSAKISLCSEIFTIIVKFRYVAKILFVGKLSPPVFVFKRLRFGFSPFYPCNIFCFGLFL